MARVVVDVMLKPEILDPQGTAVAGGARPPRPHRRHRRPPGQAVRHRASTASSRTTGSSSCTRLAEELLTNPVIEDYVDAASRTASEPTGRRRHLPRLARRPRRRARGAHRRRRGRRPLARRRTTCTASTRSSCPAASPTATTCAAARSPGSRPSWTRSSTRPSGGLPVLGICNGFQILCESHLLPGALIRNDQPALRLPRPAAAHREHRHRRGPSRLRGRPGDRRPAEERRGRLRRRRGARSTSSRARAASSPATSSSTPTAAVATSPASATSAATSSA